MTDQAQKDARIYIAYHNRQPVLTGRHLVPIQVGRAIARDILPGMQGDDTGPNISALNPDYCELTAHYWAWKNDHHQGPVGLMHYRRVFDLTQRLNPRGHVERFLLDFDEAAYRADLARHFDAGAGFDLIVPRPTRLILPNDLQYRFYHRGGDYRAMRQVVAEMHPDFLPDLDAIRHSRRFITANMFVMSRPVFQDYSALLFGILEETRMRLGDRPADQHEPRYLGFLSERIMTAYVLGARARRRFPALRIGFRGLAHLDASIPRKARPLRLARFALEGRLTPGDTLRILRGR